MSIIKNPTLNKRSIILEHSECIWWKEEENKKGVFGRRKKKIKREIHILSRATVEGNNDDGVRVFFFG